MIVFDIDELEDFMKLLSKRVTNEIFFYTRDDENKHEVQMSGEYEIVLHFLGKIDETRIGLFQTKLKFSKNDAKEKVYNEIKNVFMQNTEIKLIKGRITEGYLTY